MFIPALGLNLAEEACCSVSGWVGQRIGSGSCHGSYIACLVFADRSDAFQDPVFKIDTVTGIQFIRCSQEAYLELPGEQDNTLFGRLGKRLRDQITSLRAGNLLKNNHLAVQLGGENFDLEMLSWQAQPYALRVAHQG